MRSVARLRAAGCVFAEDEAALLLDEGADAAALEAMVVRRVAGEPLEHVLGWAAFRGRRVAVGAGVFVPGSAAGCSWTAPSRSSGRGAVVVDLCCGSGALGAAVASEAAGVELHATDIDAAAVACARRTVPPGAHVHQGDLDAALPADLRGRVDVLLASPPYVPTDGDRDDAARGPRPRAPRRARRRRRRTRRPAADRGARPGLARPGRVACSSSAPRTRPTRPGRQSPRRRPRGPPPSTTTRPTRPSSSAGGSRR